MSQTELSPTNATPDPTRGFFEEVYGIGNHATVAALRRVVPPSNTVPTGAILSDGSISFAIVEETSNIRRDGLGRIIELVSATGESTRLAYSETNQLNCIIQHDGVVLQKVRSSWFDQHGALSCWTEIVALQDGTLWCKRTDGAIVQKKLDGTLTLQNVHQQYIVWLDSQKRPQAVRYPNGQTRSFAYNAAGLCMMTEPDGSRVLLQNGGWCLEGDSTKKVLDLQAFEDGTISYRVGPQTIKISAAGVATAMPDPVVFDPAQPNSYEDERTGDSQSDNPGDSQSGNPEQPPQQAPYDSSKSYAQAQLDPDSKLAQKLRKREIVNRLLTSCPLKLDDLDPVRQHAYKQCPTIVGKEQIEILVYKTEAGTDLPLGKRLDLAAAEVSNYLFGTFPVAVVRTVEEDGLKETAIVKEVSNSFSWFEIKVQRFMSQVKDKGSEEQLRQTINDNEEFCRKLEEAAVERLIIGGVLQDRSQPLFSICRAGASYLIVNDDLEETFDPDREEPTWAEIISAESKHFFNSFVSETLSSDTLARVSSFVQFAKSDEGRARLMEVGLHEEEIDALVARAKWIEHNQRLPRC